MYLVRLHHFYITHAIFLLNTNLYVTHVEVFTEIF